MEPLLTLFLNFGVCGAMCYALLMLHRGAIQCVGDNGVLHLDFQSGPDQALPRRMLLYSRPPGAPVETQRRRRAAGLNRPPW
jgi:hypothetical protein